MSPFYRLHDRASGAAEKVTTGSYNPGVRAVGIKVLKNKLNEYVRLAAAGETILVTDHDKVVAELTPPPSRAAAALSDLVGELTAARQDR
jgi:antitoxin (DNA-binding transcriptional repressor) of toxin-antitoxin stability system